MGEGFRRHLNLWTAAALLLLGAAVYAPVVRPIVFRGDNAENYRDTVDRNTPETIFDPFLLTTSRGANTYYCPVQSIVWLGLARVFGLRTVYYCLFAVLVHIACAMLAAALARSLLGDDVVAAMTGALFLVFYPHTSTVTFVSAVITHGLCVAFYIAGLLAFITYLRTRRPSHYAATFAFFLLAHLSKETAWSMLPTMMAIEFFLFLPPEKKRFALGNVVEFSNKYFPFAFLLLAAFTVFLLKYPYGDITQSWGGASMSINVLFRFFDLASMMMVPASIPVWLKLALVNAVIVSFAAVVWRGGPLPRVLAMWIAIAILPYCISNFRPTPTLFRYLYLGSIPFSLLLAYGARRMARSPLPFGRHAYTGFAAILAVHLGAAAWTVWRSVIHLGSLAD